VILFDEMEKAHAEVFNILLQVLDEGRLTDGHGRTVDFKNALIIMTSNIGSQYIQEELDEGEIREKVTELLKTAFRPEFLNRVDETIIFHRLGLTQIKQIVGIQLAYLQRRLAARKLELSVTDRVREYLAREGFDPLYGARPLKRAIQRLLQDPLARHLLDGEFQEGDRILADLQGGEIVLVRDFKESWRAGPYQAQEILQIDRLIAIVGRAAGHGLAPDLLRPEGGHDDDLGFRRACLQQGEEVHAGLGLTARKTDVQDGHFKDLMLDGLFGFIPPRHGVTWAPAPLRMCVRPSRIVGSSSTRRMRAAPDM
jgi:hypothetical protein